MREKLYHTLNRLFKVLHIHYCLITDDEVKKSYQELVERLKKEGVYRDD